MIFRDIFQFLTASLKQLKTSFVKTGRKNFYNPTRSSRKFSPNLTFNCSSDKASFATNTSTFAQLNEFALPLRAALFDKIKGVKCSNADYANVQNVFAEFQCKNLKDYMKLYPLSRM